MNTSSSNESKIDSTDESNNFDSNSSDYERPKFVFPPAPRLCKSANNTSCSVSCQSDSSISDGKIIKIKRRSRRKNPRALPPIGVFWDIENCQVPKNKSASSVVQKIREIFFNGYREAEFIVVCDVKKENAQIIQDLHDAQINLIHVASTSKNAADEKLRQSLRRFAETHPAPSAAVLISGDVNFAADLSDLRYRKKIHVILVHNSNVADALILCANESYTFSSITENLPELKLKNSAQYELLISNLPISYEKGRLKGRLGYLSNNCGGRVVNIDTERGTAVLRFSTLDFATRAQRRLKGEDVFGYKIRVSNPASSRDSPARNYPGRKTKGLDVHPVQTYAVPTQQVFPVQDAGMCYSASQNSAEDTWKTYQDQEVQTKPPLMSQYVFQSISNIAEQGWPPPLQNSTNERRTCLNQDEACGGVFGSNKLPGAPNTSSEHTESSKGLYTSTFNKNSSVQGHNATPIELMVSNLDPTIDIKDLRKILTDLLKKYVMILSLSISTRLDGSPIAIVKVSTQQEAQYAISQLHHYKLGYKRLTISHAQIQTFDPCELREMIVALLQEVPGNRMPLFKLIELLQSRFHTNVSVSEVNKLKDVCRVTEEVGERIITLRPEARTSPTSNFNRISLMYCTVHCPNGLESRGWGEAETSQLPNVQMTLKVLGAKLNHLLSTHMGTLPLLSFPICYELEFSEPLPVDESGVPLEHLVTCVSNVKLKLEGPNRNVKYIKREMELKVADSEKEEVGLKCVSPSIVPNMQLLCREVVDLLKTTDRCQLLLSRFIPAYHHHFGRQCRVADYGYTKLIDLLESQVLSNVIQILGDGSRRIITLTHSAQMRRFTSDLLRILKTQVAKQLTTAEFAAAYERALLKPFSPVEYGLCNLEDLLEEVSEHTVVITRTNHDNITIAIPKREQTAEEIMRTKQFAEEVINLLRHSPQCSMLFNKFIPAYHHHFGHQCKVSDYGFTKLIELFEALPDTVKIEELPDGERKVCLTSSKALKVLGNQISDIIRQSKLASLPLEALSSAYLREYGYPLKYSAYECEGVDDLVSKLSEFVQVTQTTAGLLMVLVEPEAKEVLTLRIWAVLLHAPHGSSLSAFINQYRLRFQRIISAAKLEQLCDIISISSGGDEQYVRLRPFYILGAQLYHIVYQSGGQVLYSNLKSMYRCYYGSDINYADFSVNTIEDLISLFKFALVIKGHRKKTYIILNQKLSEFGIPLPSQETPQDVSYKKEDASINWPPPPAHDLILNKTERRVTPPKPDTPPTPGTVPWSNWVTPTKFSCDEYLSIPLPAIQTPKLMENWEALVSPTKNLLSAYLHPPVITPPRPTELPMPDKLLCKDDSNDSGVNNNSNTASENEMDMSAEQTGGAKPKFGSNYNKAFVTYNM